MSVAMRHAQRLLSASVLLLVTLLVLLSGCSVLPHHPLAPPQPVPEVAACRGVAVADATATPAYALHFVEFDDQGWLFPDGSDPARPDGKPSQQIDWAIGDIARQLQADHKVLSFVYVHGWKHSAAESDCDVQRFRALLRSRAALFKDRKIVGIYVGWQGNTLDAPLLRELTFWGRKNAASHVAEGRVRELFSRIRGLRAHYNGPRGGASAQDCDWTPAAHDRCMLRTVMIGHSFGGLILYSSAAPYLMEMLSVGRDLPTTGPHAPDSPRKAARARSLADLIVLLNPAFEGSRYEPLHQVSRFYQPEHYEPPILVLLTSTADWATKNAFPIARYVNTLFQYPASSSQQSVSMRRTPGHTERHLTHELCLEGDDCQGATPENEAQPWTGSRRFCGGLVLGRYPSTEIGATPIVWNVRTHGNIISDHNDIAGPHVYRFIEQLYGEVDGTNNSGCQDDYQPLAP